MSNSIDFIPFNLDPDKFRPYDEDGPCPRVIKLTLDKKTAEELDQLCRWHGIDHPRFAREALRRMMDEVSIFSKEFDAAIEAAVEAKAERDRTRLAVKDYRAHVAALAKQARESLEQGNPGHDMRPCPFVDREKED